MNHEQVEAAFAAGEAVAVWLGDRHRAVGDVGNAHTDKRLLLAILAADGRCAAFLRQRQVDETSLRHF